MVKDVGEDVVVVGQQEGREIGQRFSDIQEPSRGCFVDLPVGSPRTSRPNPVPRVSPMHQCFPKGEGGTYRNQNERKVSCACECVVAGGDVDGSDGRV
jgi:hypothetical protein